MNSVYAYIRVSTKEQNTDRQHEALKEIVKTGDTIIIKELDRLGCNFMDTPKELQYFFERSIKVIILDTPLVSTGATKLDYTINNMLINFLSYIADKERKKIQGRVIEGLKNAKAKGIKLGRPNRILPEDFKKYYSKWKDKEITGVEFAKLLSISKATLYRYIKEYEM
ncbi:recombinase family protein [Clostridium estertheticum]|uniref:recombinase family protein n=1 Tax=Clostridium estertheticum TaxID=238834 RepID=UPI001CF1B535|nr:recombinase family protein [Clostridium estertheticum]MCB2361682.1 recombinase family protein [Clostridium estertheticum]